MTTASSSHTALKLDLLTRLGSGIRPAGTGTLELGVRGGGPDFSAMLTLARSGDLQTGLPVDLTGLPEISLTSEQQDRLGAAIDRLAATDAPHALVLLDDHALLADPDARRVTGRADLRSGTPVVGIQAIATAPRGDDASAQHGSASSTTLLRALARTNAGPAGTNI